MSAFQALCGRPTFLEASCASIKQQVGVNPNETPVVAANVTRVNPPPPAPSFTQRTEPCRCTTSELNFSRLMQPDCRPRGPDLVSEDVTVHLIYLLAGLNIQISSRRRALHL